MAKQETARPSDTPVRATRAPDPVVSKADPAGAAHPLVALQQQAGNRAVTELLAKRPLKPEQLQRIPVTAPTREETLFNRGGATPGTAGAAVFGSDQGATMDMSRGGTPAVVTVTVRIRFVQQGRSLSAPDASGRTRPVDTGAMTVIPPGDARRPFAQNICDTSPAHWNNRAVLVGTRTASSGFLGIGAHPGGPVRLPIRFRAVPVFELAPVPADREIRLFPQATVAGGPIHPIDAGHFYMNKGPNYSGNDEMIYAHEYGHLIGLSDEYSQSNPQMHAVLHSADPATAAERGAAMDREAVRRMVLAALTRPLHDRVSAATGEISRTFTAGRAPVEAALGASLRNALSGATVKALLRATMPPANVRLTPLIGPLVDSAVRQFANTTGVARRVVGTEFNPASMGALIRRLYFSALSAAATRSADIGGVNMHINVGGNAGIDATGNAVIPPTGLWSGTGTAPANVGAAVDNVAGASRTGRIPPVRASGSVLRQLSSLPAGWAGFRAAAPTALSGSTLTADLTTALTAAWFNRLTAAPPAGPAIARRAALGRAVNASVNAAATAAATNGVRAFLQGELEPVMRTSTTALMSSIGDEVTRIMGTPANQLALTAPRDPDIAALATAMQARMTAQATAATTAQTAAGGTAINPGTTAPDQEVTYSSVNMMSDNTDIFRQDQFTHLATLFNAQSALRQSGEGDVHAELGAR